MKVEWVMDLPEGKWRIAVIPMLCIVAASSEHAVRIMWLDTGVVEDRYVLQREAKECTS